MPGRNVNWSHMSRHSYEQAGTTASRQPPAFSRSTASVKVRFFLASSTILDSRMSADTASPPVSTSAVRLVTSRSFASSAYTSSALRCVSSWTWLGKTATGRPRQKEAPVR
jgi:hypothetical protein